jgi:hypothetical protein
LGYAEMCRRPRKVEIGGHLDEVPQMSQFHD